MNHKREYSGRLAEVRYIGFLEDGTLIEDLSDGEPQTFIIGSGQVPPGIDEALYEMEIGETRTVEIPCEKAYGLHDPEGVVVYPRSSLALGSQIKVGDELAWTHPVSNVVVPVRCVEANDVAVTMDFNHPLAGKKLIYTLELVSVIDLESE